MIKDIGYLTLNSVSFFLVEGLVKFVETRFTMSTDQQQKDYHFIISLIINNTDYS